MENVIRNAVDYAGGSSVTICADGDEAVVGVSDAGPGIREANQARQVRPFKRGEASRSRDMGRIGLGLSIV